VWRAAAVLAVAVIATLVVVRAQSQNAPPPATRTSATAWRLPSLVGGGEVSLAGLRGHPAVVDFFASWCTACRGELPGFAVLSEQLRGQVTFVGVDSEENGDGLAMARQLGIGAWPLARDVGGTQASGLHDALGARGMPLTAFYDRSGRLLAVVVGAISEDDLGGRLRALYGVSA
jgi:cytochrome c biogenesis protein CcmG/thiol:disulfide interchange protein DsbE